MTKQWNFQLPVTSLTLPRGLPMQAARTPINFARRPVSASPQTLDAAGTVLSILYRLACCYYGCPGRGPPNRVARREICKSSCSVYLLVRTAQYDEALMLIRGMGGMANLLSLFQEDRAELIAWKAADKKTRLNHFGPGAVRRRLEKLSELGPPIDAERYAALREIATHPTPSLAPGHYSGTGRPVLGAFFKRLGFLSASMS